MNLRVDHVRLGTGAEIDEFHLLEYPDWTCIVCRTQEDEIVMVEQYRHGIERVIRELPAGVVGEAEPALEAAKRELLEETGYESDAWISLGRFSTEPSRHSNWAHFFFAGESRRVSAPDLDESEDVDTLVVPLDELKRQMENGSLVHGVQLSALLLAEKRGFLD